MAHPRGMRRLRLWHTRRPADGRRPRARQPGAARRTAKDVPLGRPRFLRAPGEGARQVGVEGGGGREVA